MMRAFIGIRVDPAVARRISEAQAELKQNLPGVRWVGEENLHFTLKFLGPIEEEKTRVISEALERILQLFPPFTILARGIGVFPDIRRARVVWVGLEGQNLAPLAAGVETALEGVGFARERREFKPHLTIGRWRDFNGRAELLRNALESWEDYDFGPSRVEEVIFFQSVLKAEGAVYSPLAVIALSNQLTTNEK